MSGLDVAGLALGALPLAILAVKQGIEVKHTIKDWRKIERTYIRVKNRLTYSNLFLRLQLRKLVLPLLVDAKITDEDLDSLIEQPTSVRWKQGKIDVALKKRLSDAHEEYFNLLQELAETLAELWDKLGVSKPEFQQIITQRLNDSTEQNPASRLMSRANARFQIQRTRLVLSKRSMTELLDGIQDNLNRLEQLLRAVDEIAELSGRLNDDLQISEDLFVFSNHADKIHSLMVGALACDQDCLHRAQVWLQQEMVPRFDFRLQILSEKKKAAAQSPLMPHGQEISVTKRPTSSQYPVLRRSSHSSSETQSPDLCAAVSSYTPCGIHLLDLQDGINKVSYSVHAAPKRSAGHRTTSLAELLIPIRNTVPSRLDRYEIALRIAVAKLHFYQTPWLEKGISSNEIRIPQSKSGKAETGAAFVETALSKHNAVETTRYDPVETFRDLAVALLELCFGKRLEDHEGWSDIESCQDPDVKRRAKSGFIQELADAALRETGSSYQGAIKWCLSEEYAKDMKWKHGFAQNVVGPLQDCCRWMDPHGTKVSIMAF